MFTYTIFPVAISWSIKLGNLRKDMVNPWFDFGSFAS